jgi:purine-binding chemotaxis protein CheW
VDEVAGVAECAEADLVEPDAVVPGTALVRGIAKLADGLVVIHDLDAFLSLDEERTLDRALAGALDADAD